VKNALIIILLLALACSGCSPHILSDAGYIGIQIRTETNTFGVDISPPALYICDRETNENALPDWMGGC
jgi:hypothetical protein